MLMMCIRSAWRKVEHLPVQQAIFPAWSQVICSHERGKASSLGCADAVDVSACSVSACESVTSSEKEPKGGKWYLQIKTIREEQLIHILYKPPGEDLDKPPSVWRVTAAYWGVKSSGVVAMQAIVKTFEEVANNENSSKMEKHVALTAPSHFYVDDGSFSQNGKSGILFSDEDDMFNYYETMHCERIRHRKYSA